MRFLACIYRMVHGSCCKSTGYHLLDKFNHNWNDKLFLHSLIQALNLRKSLSLFHESYVSDSLGVLEKGKAMQTLVTSILDQGNDILRDCIKLYTTNICIQSRSFKPIILKGLFSALKRSSSEDYSRTRTWHRRPRTLIL